MNLVSGTQPLVFFFFFFREYSIENEGRGNSFTFFVTFPGMLAVTAENNKYNLGTILMEEGNIGLCTPKARLFSSERKQTKAVELCL